MRNITAIFAILLSVLMTAPSAFATASSATTTKTTTSWDAGKKTRIVTVAWLGASSNGAFTDYVVSNLAGGFLMKVVTDPGTTAPTDNYDIELDDASGIDALIGQLANRDTTTTEAVYPVTASGQLPVFMEAGSYTLKISNNSVGSATGVIKMYFVDSL